MAQKRFRAVGRVALNLWKEASRAFQKATGSLASMALTATNTPRAAVTPMAGAPRTTIVSIAWATSSTVRNSRKTSSAGSFR